MLNIITRYYRRSRAEGFRPAADWQVEVTGGPLPSRCNPFLGQHGYGFMWSVSSDEALLAGFGEGDPRAAAAFVRRFQAACVDL